MGEAAFQMVVPPYVEDFSPPRYRSICLSLFYTAIPCGTAIGYFYGAAMASHATWGFAFVVEARS